MAYTKTILAACLVVALVMQPAFSQSCALTAAQVSSGDYSKVPAACNNLGNTPSEKACSTCICALTDAFTPVLQAAGVNVTGVSREQATSAITACVNVIAGPLSRAGVDVFGLASLQSCTAEPTCLSSAVAAASPSPSPKA